MNPKVLNLNDAVIFGKVYLRFDVRKCRHVVIENVDIRKTSWNFALRVGGLVVDFRGEKTTLASIVRSKLQIEFDDLINPEWNPLTNEYSDV